MEGQDAAIEKARRIEEFLADEAVKEAFARVEEGAYRVFRSSTTDDEMRAARATLQAIDELKTQLRVTVDRGARASADKAREESRQNRPNRR